MLKPNHSELKTTGKGSICLTRSEAWSLGHGRGTPSACAGDAACQAVSEWLSHVNTPHAPQRFP